MPLSPVIVPPRAQASRRCETQAPLSGKPPSCAKRFGPLTPSARSGNLIAGDGTKNGLPAPNKELTANPKQPLDRKSPIQVACEPLFNARQTALDKQNDTQGPCAEVRALAASHLAEVRAKIADLGAMERVPADAVRRCAAGELPGCPLTLIQ